MIALFSISLFTIRCDDGTQQRLEVIEIINNEISLLAVENKKQTQFSIFLHFNKFFEVFRCLNFNSKSKSEALALL